MDSNICTEKWNKTTRVKVTCQYCNHEACRMCYERWILNESLPKCMDNTCGREWTRNHLTKMFTAKFISTKLKEHRETVLFDIERALLPATQPLVEEEIRIERLDEQTNNLYAKIAELHAQITDLRMERYRGVHQRTGGERSVFVRGCPSEECRGFLSSQWKCGLCEKWVCPECHEIKGNVRDGDHVCDPDRLATARLISNDTKPCPTCGTGIFKIDGCDQMFCTQCHTGFSWRTGRIETNIHNPHYFEWIRRTGGNVDRNPNEIQCGQEITHAMARNMYSRLRTYRTEPEIRDRVTAICESIIHLRLAEMPRFEVDHILNNQSLRVEYMRNKITEERFRMRLQRDDKRHNKNREIHNLLATFVTASTDIVYRFHVEMFKDEFANESEDSEYRKQCYSILKEFKPLVRYSNECFAEISKAYSSKQLFINKRFRLANYVQPTTETTV